MRTPYFIRHIYLFYRDGIKAMTVGKTLWIVALIKLFIIFVVLKLFFFPNYLNTNFKSDKSKADHVRQELIRKSN